MLALACTAMHSCEQAGEADGRIRSDRDGMLVIQGRRTFIVGSYYGYEGDGAFENMALDGYNYVRVGKDRAALDQAWAHGLYSWISIGYLEPGDGEENIKRFLATIEELKDHPGLLCWETQDEPAFTWNSEALRVMPEPLIDTYEKIKQADPEHLVYMNHGPVNLVSTLRSYNPANDVIACDIYPVIPDGIRPMYALFPDGKQGDLLNVYISQVGEYTDKMRKVGGVSRPLFMVLQGFSWEMLRPEKDRRPDMILYPDYHQTRFMAYQAIIHGANGILYWGTRYTPPDAPFWEDLKRVTRELGGMQKVLAAPAGELEIGMRYHELGHSVDAGVEILIKELEDGLCLITANADRYPVKVSLEGLGAYRQASVFPENRILVIEDGELTDDYRAFDVHVYFLTRTPSP